MEDIYPALPEFISSVSLIMCIVYIHACIQAKNASDLFIGFIGLMATSLFFPPAGYEAFGVKPNPVGELLMRSLLYAYYVFSLWYISRYRSGGKKYLIILFVLSTIVSVVLLMIIPVWVFIAALLYCGLPIIAIRISSLHFRGRYSIRWIVSGFSIYQAWLILSLILTMMHAGDTGSLHYRVRALLLFSALAGTSIIVLYNKLRLEHMLDQCEFRWDSLVQGAPLIVVEVDHEGAILCINGFGTKLLGYDEPTQLVSLNWFDTFVLPSDAKILREIYSDISENKSFPSSFKNTIRNKDGKDVIVNWVNFITHKRAGNIPGLIAIGLDSTAEERNNELVARLKMEIEKEKIVYKNTDVLVREENAVGKSQAFAYAIQRARQVATTHAPVLLEGETGVGKEVFANIIHKSSSRSSMPFIKVNCGALPKDLIEDELFGHEKGAFTSAIQARKGRFELADGGTIFLDEIGELPLEMQPKMLRVLQQGEFERLGGQKTIKVDVRILAATNRDLSKEISNGNFRSDLYYRLNVFPITIPALRNRKEDIPELIHFFIDQESRKYHKAMEEISKADMQRLVEYPWPGNIRELKNVIERAVIVSDGGTLRLDWWSKAEQHLEVVQSDQSLEKIEKDHILAVMKKCHWKINGEHGAAEMLDMNPNTLRSKMKRLDIVRPVQNKPVVTPGFDS